MTIDEALEQKPSDADDDWEPPPVKTTWLDVIDHDIFHTPFSKYTAALCVPQVLVNHGENSQS